MFVYTVKANTLKLFGIIAAAAICLTLVLVFCPGLRDDTLPAVSDVTEEYNYTKIKTNEDRIGFLGQFGWTVDSEPTEEVTMRIPADFDKMFASYNELQKKMGLDLTEYKGKEVTRYTYTVKNYPDYSGKVLANVFVYRNRVIGGDISSADVEGFITTFEQQRNIIEKLGGENGTSGENTVKGEVGDGSPES